MTELMIVLGSPASGKTTLARRLMGEFSMPCLCKDDVKEALLDHTVALDRASSKRLSDLSFAAVLRLAGTQLAAGVSCMIEGNWRAAHAAPIVALLEAAGARCAQVWCRASPEELRRRFRSRARHPAHLDAAISAEELLRSSLEPPSFLDVPGPCWVYDSDDPAAYDDLKSRCSIWR